MNFDGDFCKVIGSRWNFWQVEIENAQYILKQSGKPEINEKQFGNICI